MGGRTPSATNIDRTPLPVFSIAGAAVVLLLVALLLVVLAVVDLVKVVHDNNDASPQDGTWQSKLSSFRERIWQAVPLTAIKTILVVWQIVTQVIRWQGYRETDPSPLSQVVQIFGNSGPSGPTLDSGRRKTTSHQRRSYVDYSSLVNPKHSCRDQYLCYIDRRTTPYR